MKQFVILPVVFIVLSIPTLLSAQTSVKNTFEGLANITESLLHLENQKWAYHAEDGSNLFYIDFEKINVNLNKVLVKSANGSVVFQEEVWDLPVDSIYEIDLSALPKGNYTVEVDAFTKAFQKEVSVN